MPQSGTLDSSGFSGIRRNKRVRVAESQSVSSSKVKPGTYCTAEGVQAEPTEDKSPERKVGICGQLRSEKSGLGFASQNREQAHELLCPDTGF